jgi:glycosyltransferase involved in cell wall biosynthesis
VTGGHPRLVLHVITRMILGGAQENTLLSAEGTRASPGWDSVLVTGPSVGPEGRLLELARERQVPVRVVPSLIRAPHPVRDLQALLHLWWLCWRLRPAVVHTHSSKAGILGRLAARLAGVPVVIHTIHGLPFHEHQGSAEHRLYVLLERLAARLANRILGVADAMCAKAMAAGVGYPSQFEVVHSGMECEPFLAAGRDDALQAAVRRRYGIEPRDRVLMLVGRLFELKGHDDLLEVAPAIASAVPDLRLVFVGDGIRREELTRRVGSLGLAGRVVFTGLVSPQEMPGLVAAADLLVHTSLREGLARVLPQALLAGTPVVSYDIDGAGEIVHHGETGVLLMPGDLDGLTAWCVRLLEHATEARRMALAGRDLCARLFPAVRMVRRLLAVYEGELRGLPSR